MWFINARSHCTGSCVLGKPSISLGLFRLPAGLPAPFLRPPHPFRDLIDFVMGDFFPSMRNRAV